MWAIYGLGNPVRQYGASPHNIGMACLDLIAQRLQPAPHTPTWANHHSLKAELFQPASLSGSSLGTQPAWPPLDQVKAYLGTLAGHPDYPEVQPAFRVVPHRLAPDGLWVPVDAKSKQQQKLLQQQQQQGHGQGQGQEQGLLKPPQKHRLPPHLKLDFIDLSPPGRGGGGGGGRDSRKAIQLQSQSQERLGPSHMGVSASSPLTASGAAVASQQHQQPADSAASGLLHPKKRWLPVETPMPQLVLVRPQTYMNLSGEAVRLVNKHFGIPPERTIVLHDDVDTPLGRIKVKDGGGAGGHNGLRSIDQCLGGNQGYLRLRIGVGRNGVPKDNSPAAVQALSEFVLSPFPPGQRKVLQPGLERIAWYLPLLLEGEHKLFAELVNAASKQ